MSTNASWKFSSIQYAKSIHTNNEESTHSISYYRRLKRHTVKIWFCGLRILITSNYVSEAAEYWPTVDETNGRDFTRVAASYCVFVFREKVYPFCEFRKHLSCLISANPLIIYSWFCDYVNRRISLSFQQLPRMYISRV